MSEWKEFREEMMQYPDVKAAYDAHAPERELAHALIAQHIATSVTQKEMAGGIKKIDILRRNGV